jgi:hypothetical protein
MKRTFVILLRRWSSWKSRPVPPFKLDLFPAEVSPNIEITGFIERIENRISIRYAVGGDVKKIMFPPLSEFPSRKDELWKGACFEFFLAISGQPPYWEFNMSPSGDWNVYRMDAYRRVGFREEMAIAQLPFNFDNNGSKISLELSVDLSRLFHVSQPLQTSITAIVQTPEGQETYWALAHPGKEADFHLRESFSIHL